MLPISDWRAVVGSSTNRCAMGRRPNFSIRDFLIYGTVGSGAEFPA
jgi:hypothetical protein